MWKETLQERKVPDLMTFNDGTKVVTPADWRKRREEILDILRREIYGYAPEPPKKVEGKIIGENYSEWNNSYAFGNHAHQERVEISFDTPKGKFSFPVSIVYPKSEKPVPVFLLINFLDTIPNKYYPAEELVHRGYAVVQMYYEDVSQDNNHSPEKYEHHNDYFMQPTDGLSAMYPRDEKNGWGKIGVWAWAASRVMDYICTRPEFDSKRVAVVGHSRLGKTALWCGAQDERFSMVCSNDSGCGGAALFRDKIGENVRFMADAIPFWFCGNYLKYIDAEHDMPFDQHWLLSLIAPRALVISSAEQDSWSDPWSEMLATWGAAPAFLLNGEKGLLAEDRKPIANDLWLEGNPAYQMREGSHYFSRTDWLIYMQYREMHGNKF